MIAFLARRFKSSQQQQLIIFGGEEINRSICRRLGKYKQKAKNVEDHCSPRSAHHWPFTKMLPSPHCSFPLKDKTDRVPAPPLVRSDWPRRCMFFGRRRIPSAMSTGTSGPAVVCGAVLGAFTSQQRPTNSVACWHYRPESFSSIPRSSSLLFFFFPYFIDTSICVITFPYQY